MDFQHLLPCLLVLMESRQPVRQEPVHPTVVVPHGVERMEEDFRVARRMFGSLSRRWPAFFVMAMLGQLPTASSAQLCRVQLCVL